MQAIIEKFSYLIVSALLSSLIHVFLLVFSPWIPVRALPTTLDMSRPAPTRRLLVRAIELPEQIVMPEPQPHDPEGAAPEAAIDLAAEIRGGMAVTRIFDEQGLLDSPRPEVRLRNPRPGSTGEEWSGEARRWRPASGPRPSILTMDEEFAALTPLATERPTVARAERVTADEPRLPSLFHDSDRVAAAVWQVGLRSPDVAMPELARPDPGAGLAESGEPGREVKAEEPSRRRPPSMPELTRTEADEEGEPSIGRLDRLLQVAMTVFREADGSGYFRLDISPNPASERLRAVAKDVLFLIDTSGSIPERKLDAFRLAVDNALEYLNPQDRFNVVAFRARPERLFEDYLPPTAAALARARFFLRGLESRGRTDIHGGLAPFVEAEARVEARPLTIFVLTDGVSTVRDRLDNRQIIRHVGQSGRDDISIFTVSAGRQVNRNLLDLLALTNRGRPLHDEDLGDFSDILKDFIAAHSEIIVTNLQYRVSGGEVRDVYPRQLPHLARNQMISLYGRFPAGSESVAIQLMGRNAAGELEEFVYRARIDEKRDAGPALRQRWLVQRALHLFTEEIMEPSPERQAELQRLARDYNIQFPEL